MFHDDVLKLYHYLGYDDDSGVCHGFSVRFLESRLSGEEQIFDDRIEKIISYSKDLANFDKLVTDAKTRVKNKEPLTDEDKEIFDILAFYDSLALYHTPDDYHDIFKTTYAQGNIEEISTLSASDSISKKGGLKQVYSESSIYNLDERKIVI